VIPCQSISRKSRSDRRPPLVFDLSLAQDGKDFFQGEDIRGAGELLEDLPVRGHEPAALAAGKTEVNGIIDGKIMAQRDSDSSVHDFLIGRNQNVEEVKRPDGIEDGRLADSGFVPEDVGHFITEKVGTADLQLAVEVILKTQKRGT